ncbi:MAG: NAD-dependent DNA ligase LigA [Myxococcota bacterium]
MTASRASGTREDHEDPAVRALAERIRQLRERYHYGEPEVSDAAFDALEDRLRTLAPDHPVLGEVGAPPPTEGQDKDAEAADDLGDVSDAPNRLKTMSESFYALPPGVAPEHASAWRDYRMLYLAIVQRDPEHPVLREIVPARGFEWPKASHEIPMGSLNKVNSADELRDWAARCDEMAEKAGLPSVSSRLAVTEKLDGISIELVYDHGRFETAITRGDGEVGECVGPNVRRMKGVPDSIRHRGRVSVRGEIIMTKTDSHPFHAFKRRVDPKFERVKSLRNTASGIARTKDLKHLPALKFLRGRFYDVEGVEGLDTESEKVDWLQAQGFEVPFFVVTDLDGAASLHASYQDEKRKELDHEIDGLVVRAHHLPTFTILGELNRRPRAAVAFKFGNEMELTTLLGIEWSTGDSGRITPVARIEPVFLAGAEVRNASLHNLGLVQSLGVGVGDQVLVSRRNDVIPYVEDVVVSAGRAESPPEACGTCQHPVQRDGEYLICPNLECPARMKGRIKVWIKQLGLLEWGEKTVDTLFERGLVREPADLYRLSADAITDLHGYGETTALKLLQPLRGKMKLPLPTFIAALAIPTVSKETGKLLVRAGFDDLEKLHAATTEQLAAVEGLGTIKAEKIIEGLELRKEEIQRLRAVGVEPVRPEAGGPLNGLSFAFSGAHSRPRKELAALVESQGGTVTSGVTKGLHYLVLKDPSSTSSKAEKARKLDVKIIDEHQLEKLIAGNDD